LPDTEGDIAQTMREVGMDEAVVNSSVNMAGDDVEAGHGSSPPHPHPPGWTNSGARAHSKPRSGPGVGWWALALEH
jgi:hypothetical protein